MNFYHILNFFHKQQKIKILKINLQIIAFSNLNLDKFKKICVSLDILKRKNASKFLKNL